MQAKVVKIDPNFPEKDLINEAGKILQDGGLVAFPTETVYGIAVNNLSRHGIEKLYKIKQRPLNKPFTIHIARFEALEKLGILLSSDTQKLIHKFWPGPLTIVSFNKQKEKVGVRMPINPIALSLIETVDFPISAPSANISGKEPPISAEAVIADMKDSIDMILDGGNTELGIESTVLDVTTSPFIILREGAIPKEDLLASYHVLFVCTGNTCRSVMSKAILEKFLKSSGLTEKVRVDSAGVSAYNGVPPAFNTIEVLKEEGMDISMYKGKRITPSLLKKSDFIFVMEESHKALILNMVPGINKKVRLLGEEDNVPDPIGQEIREYRRVRDIIKDRVENVFLELFKLEIK